MLVFAQYISYHNFLFMTSLIETFCYELQRRASAIQEQYKVTQNYIEECSSMSDRDNYDLWNNGQWKRIII
jgi:hypothetical protein